MSDMDFINFLMIDNANRGVVNGEKLGDMRDRAAYIAKKTGQEPESWYEFKMRQPQEKPHTLRNMLIGGVIGVLLGAITLNPVFALGIGLTGAIFGAFVDTNATRRENHVEAYSKYLDVFEGAAKQHARGVNMQQEMVDKGKDPNFVARLMTEREKAATQGLSV